jgi:pimeloyl-ACP methyl ester carboxylesterase
MQSRRSLTASDGVELAYWLWRATTDGDRLLVLLHGAASNHTRWSEFVEHTRLTGTWSILAPDLRGNGESMVRGGQTCEVWSRDLVEILETEILPSAVVVGHSMGAQIAVHLAYRCPEKVCGLVLIDPVFPQSLRGKQRRLWQLRWPLRAAWALIRSLNALGIHRREIANRDLRELDEKTREALRGAESIDEIARQYTSLRPILRTVPTANYLAQLVSTVGPLPPLASIQIPVAVLLSGAATFADAEINRENVARFPKGEVITIQANHWPLTEAPDETREAIEGWLEKTFGSRKASGLTDARCAADRE